MIFLIGHRNIGIINAFKDSAIPTTTWFLLSLFEVSIISQLILRYVNNSFIRLIIALILAYIGYILNDNNIGNNSFVFKLLIKPLYINTSLMCIIYYILENSIYPVLRKIFNNIRTSQIVLFGLFLLVITFLLWTIHRPYLFYKEDSLPDNFCIVVISAVLGSIGILFVSRLFSSNRLLIYIGQNSLIIFGIHLYFILLLERVLDLNISFLVFLMASILSVVSVPILKKLFPRFTGVKPLFKLIS